MFGRSPGRVSGRLRGWRRCVGDGTLSVVIGEGLLLGDDLLVWILLAMGGALLAENANAILGHPRGGRRTRIMVTMPREAASDAGLLRALLEAAGLGADDARAMVAPLRRAHDAFNLWRRVPPGTAEALGRATEQALDLYRGPLLGHDRVHGLLAVQREALALR